MDDPNRIPQFPEDLIAIQHCREDRFERECIYLGPGGSFCETQNAKSGVLPKQYTTCKIIGNTRKLENLTCGK